MTMNDSHQAFIDSLSDYLDGELDAGEHAAVEEHLAGCAECRAVLGDLRTIVHHASHLPVSRPESDLWTGVEGRIQSPPPAVLPFGHRRRRTFAFTLPQIAAAGIALIVMSGGLVYVAREGRPSAPVAEVSEQHRDAAISPVSLADPRYEDAVEDLERILAEGRGRLDPETVRVLEQNLATIDKAIAQSRQALDADPGNVFLNSHLISARQRKLTLLRRATALTTGS
jgi:hypothetical protein